MSQSLRLWLIKQILTCRNTLWTNNVWTVLCRTLRSENIFVKKRQKIVLRPGNTELTRATVRERERQWDKNRSWWETLGCISTQQQRKLTSSTTHTQSTPVHKADTKPGTVPLHSHEYTDVLYRSSICYIDRWDETLSRPFKTARICNNEVKQMDDRKEVEPWINYGSFVNSPASGCVFSLKTNDD